MLLGSGLIIMTYLVGQRILDGQMEIGDFVMINGYLLLLFNPLEQMAGLFRKILSETATLSHSIELLKQQAVIEEVPNAKDLIVNNAAIEFKNVSFNYQPGKTIISDLNLSIPEKSMTAIVGTSGSGKSTISRLLFRFYDLTNGEILIDQQNIQNI